MNLNTNEKKHINQGYRAMEVITQKTRPEPAVLTDNSLHTLAKEIDADLRFVMLLCIPTTRIIRLKIDADSNGWPASLLTHQLLLEWKAHRAAAKDKEKVADIEKALREIGKQDVADVFVDRHRQNIDITPDAFQA